MAGRGMDSDWEASGGQPCQLAQVLCPTGRCEPCDPGSELHVTDVGEGNEGTGAQGEAWT